MARVPARWLTAAASLLAFGLVSVQASATYTNFETVPVRPLALSPDGRTLFAVNTPDGRLEIFDVLAEGLHHRASLRVGLEPVAVAARTDDEVWVVNHLSDSVSVVDVGASPPRVVRTLLVGDAPWDVVFAGPRRHRRGPFERAFVSAARRGQNHPQNANAELKTPGLGRADVWVFDTSDLGEEAFGRPETIVTVFGDKPRPLAASPDGSRVYVGIFHSGSRTTTVNPQSVCDGGEDRGPCTWQTAGADDPPAEGEIGIGSPPVLPGGVPGPNVDPAGNPAPEVGLILKYDAAADVWRDAIGRNWNGAVPFRLPDLDVFAIDALADPPVEVQAFAGVGTILFNMAVHPSGSVYVANTAANNHVRFEGPGEGTTSVRGHLHEARITRLDPDGTVTPRHLNKHIDYDAFPQPAGAADRSLATPHEMAFSRNGRKLYLAAFGSRKLGIFDVAALDDDRFEPDPADHVELSGDGPAGLVVDDRRGRIYVYTRLANAISIVDPKARREIAAVPLADPEPAVVREGRRFLYDARFASSNGEASCSACHVLGDMDDLAWNLGNPSAVAQPNPNPFLGNTQPSSLVHPLKGPMTTQTLRGMRNHGPMHWRGDRTGANDPTSGDAFDEEAGFRAFNGAFESLLGRDAGPIPEAQMQQFAEFALTIFMPPNPVRALDNRDAGRLASGRRTFFQVRTVDDFFTCDSCHDLDESLGHFGASGLTVFDPGDVKIPQIRNVYEKVGAFGFVGRRQDENDTLGDQIRGFGLGHHGSLGGVRTFFGAAGFEFPLGMAQQEEVEDFVLAFPSNLAPIVGQQITRQAGSPPAVDQRIDLLLQQAATPWIIPGNPGPMSCDVVVSGVVAGEARGWWYDPASSRFVPDREADTPMLDADLRALAEQPGQALTFTCEPPGSGPRMGIDRDDDGWRDGDERALLTDPDAPGSLPGACSDGLDNDGDGVADYPADPDCHAPSGRSEIAGPAVASDVYRGRVRAGSSRPVPVVFWGALDVDPGRIDLATTRFGPGGAPALSDPPDRFHDWNRDGLEDRLVFYDAGQTGLEPGLHRACVEGEIDGAWFRSCDAVRVLPCRPRDVRRGWCSPAPVAPGP